MSRHYFTFGENHRQEKLGLHLGPDDVIVIDADSHRDARELMFILFGNRWSMMYGEANWNPERWFGRERYHLLIWRAGVDLRQPLPQQDGEPCPEGDAEG